MPRRYILDVLFWPRDDRGEPIFPPDLSPSAGSTGYLHDLAVSRGIPHPQAMQWARAVMAQEKKRG